MGHHTWADVVPFVMHNVFRLEHDQGAEDLPTDELRALTCIDQYIEGEYLDEQEYKKRQKMMRVFARNIEFRGWKYAHKNKTWLGKNKSLLGDACFRKDSHVVWIVNESEYSNIGEYRMAVVANDRASIEQFKKDFEIKRAIEETDSVTQSG